MSDQRSEHQARPNGLTCSSCSTPLPASAIPGSVAKCSGCQRPIEVTLEDFDEPQAPSPASAPVGPDAGLCQAVRAYLGDGDREALVRALEAAERGAGAR